MKKIILILSLILIASNANAEQWIKCIDTTIGTVNFERPQPIEGDCLSLGLCSGANNTGLATNVFEAVGNEWIQASQSNKKCARGSTPGFRILDLSAQEIADIQTSLNSQQDAALRVNSKAQYNGQHETALALRCMAKSIIDEINTLRASYPIPIASITRSGTTATVTTRWAHNLTGTPQVTVHGATLAAYNGTITANVTGATTFTYTVNGNPTSPAAGGITVYPVNSAMSQRTLTQSKTAIQSCIDLKQADE